MQLNNAYIFFKNYITQRKENEIDERYKGNLGFIMLLKIYLFFIGKVDQMYGETERSLPVGSLAKLAATPRTDSLSSTAFPGHV